MAKVRIESGPLRGQSITLPDRGTVAVGRDVRCAVRVDDAMVSRVHCILHTDGDRCEVEDRRSSNGTLVGGEPVQRAALQDGDIVRVGETLLSFVLETRDPRLGRTVAGYRIETLLGRGAAGTVYRAHQLSVDRTVAIKILARRLAEDDVFLRAFMEEARAAGRLNHPNVVQVYDAGQDGEDHYISMEFLAGGTLEQAYSEDGRLPVPQAIQAGIDAAKALAFAEQHHIVHRDIKPANLLLDPTGTVKLADLGIAADLRYKDQGAAGRAAGSPRYMAPEQATGASVDHRADIYGLGSTIFRAVAGVPPFDGPTPKAIIQAKLESDPPTLRQVAPDTPIPLSRVVQKMMARSPDDRYSSAAEVEEALERALRTGPAPRARRPAVAAARVARAATKPARTAKRSSSGSPVVITIVGILALLATLIAVSAFLRRPSGDENGSGREPVSGRTDPGPSRTPEPSGRGGAYGSNDRAASEERVRQAVAIDASYSAGEIDGREAARRLEALLDRYPGDSALRAQVDRSMAAIEADERASSEAVAREARERIAPLIEAGRLTEAEEVLGRVERDSASGPEAFAALRRELEAAVSKRLETETARTRSLIAAGDLDAATQAIDALASSLPASAAARIEALRADVEREREKRAQGREDVLSTARSVREAIAALDFVEAERILSERLPDRPDLAKIAAPLRRELAAVRGVWEHLRSRMEERRASRKYLNLAADGSSKTSRYVVDAVSGPLVRLRSGTGSRATYRTVAILSIGGEILAEELEGIEGIPASAARKGLARLLLLRRGPGAAGNGSSSLGGYWRPGRLATARGLRATFEGEPPATDGWQFLADEAAALMKAWKEAPGYDGVRAELRELFSLARGRALAGRPPDSLFHARTVEITSGKGEEEGSTVVRLGFDFSDADQLLDFHSPGAGSLRWIKSKRLLELKGEARLLLGEPFRERLAIEAWVPARGYPAESPNINVAFWTEEEDVVTISADLDPRRWRNRGRQNDDDDRAPSDYFALGTGYRIEIDFEELGGLGRLARGLQGFLPTYLREPTYVILSGRHGARLHEAYPRDLIWDEPTGNTLRGAVRLEAALDGASLDWKVNGRTLDYDGARGLARLERGVPHGGSLTLFTNGGTVLFSKIEVEGWLDPEWVESRVAVQVERELEAIDGPIDGPIDGTVDRAPSTSAPGAEPPGVSPP